MNTGFKDINGEQIFVGNRLKLNVSHFKGTGTVVLKDGIFLIQWGEKDFSKLDGDHLYSKVIENIPERDLLQPKDKKNEYFN